MAAERVGGVFVRSTIDRSERASSTSTSYLTTWGWSAGPLTNKAPGSPKETGSESVANGEFHIPCLQWLFETRRKSSCSGAPLQSSAYSFVGSINYPLTSKLLNCQVLVELGFSTSK